MVNPAQRSPAGAARWLRFRERNERVLQGAVKVGFGRTIRKLAEWSGYRPETARFFQLLGWEQKQAKDGRRSQAVGVKLARAETWDGLSEREVCERIASGKEGGYKRIVGMLPASVGLTRAVLSAMVEAKAVSAKELVILAPTSEELGLASDPVAKTVKGREL